MYSKINIFYLFGVSIDVDQSVVVQSCPQDPTQQVGARFAALAATCVACEAAGAVAKATRPVTNEWAILLGLYPIDSEFLWRVSHF